MARIVWALVVASGYTSETHIDLFSTEEKANKAFQETFETFIEDSENDTQGESFLDYAIDDINDKLGTEYTKDDTECIDWNSVETLYKIKVMSEKHFRYDDEVITEVSVQKMEELHGIAYKAGNINWQEV